MPVIDWQNDNYTPKYLSRLHQDVLAQRDQHTLKWLNLHSEDVILEIGAETGRFSISIAPLVKRVIAIDKSIQSIRKMRFAARKLGITNLTSQVAGFLDYDVKEESVDRVITRDGLHHLTDMQKSSALERIYKVLKPGGVLLIMDIIPEFSLAMMYSRLPEIQNVLAGDFGAEFTTTFSRTIKREHPICFEDLVSMLTKAGFEVSSFETAYGVHSTLYCIKK